MIDNKELVQKTKDFLSKKNIYIKTSDVYELYSFLSNEKSWNVASSKKINFNEKLKINPDDQSIDIPELFKNLKENGPFLVDILLKKLNCKLIEKSSYELFNIKCKAIHSTTVIVGEPRPVEYREVTYFVTYFFDDLYYSFKKNQYNIEMKHIEQLSRVIRDEEDSYGLIITSSRAIPNEFRSACRSNKIELIDLEDFKKALLRKDK